MKQFYNQKYRVRVQSASSLLAAKKVAMVAVQVCADIR